MNFFPGGIGSPVDLPRDEPPVVQTTGIPQPQPSSQTKISFAPTIFESGNRVLLVNAMSFDANKVTFSWTTHGAVEIVEAYLIVEGDVTIQNLSMCATASVGNSLEPVER
jgi:hypothetical protein